MILLGSKIASVLSRWLAWAQQDWRDCPDRPGLGYYGTGYNDWGVQTNQKYVAAAGTLATWQDLDVAGGSSSREHLAGRALAGLRYSLATHKTGDYACMDGRKWGHTWISALGIERMMSAVHAMDGLLADADRAALRRVLVSEADYQLGEVSEEAHHGVGAGLWADSRRNWPESNYWNGALLVRTAAMYADHPNAGAWLERGVRFLVNAISVPADAACEQVLDGKPVRERHVGANFFPNYALDHHGYLNVGYMVICLSNAAMLHYGMKMLGAPVPQSAYHHVEDLWQVVKGFLFQDGRLARVGGDTRQRYCYCQDYLAPSLVMALDVLGDPDASPLLEGAVGLATIEQDHNGDGSFLSDRCGRLRQESLYYYTRLESDKACTLAMAAQWLRQAGKDFAVGAKPRLLRPIDAAWAEPEHGAVMHRCRTRLASWSWRAAEPPQGLCLPPAASHLAEWSENMAGRVRLAQEPRERKTVLRHVERLLPGGFLTAGAMADGMRAELAEGWRTDDPVPHQYAVAALPDGRTMVVMEYCRPEKLRRVFLKECKGFKLNVPNDLFNRNRRSLSGEFGRMRVKSPARQPEALELDSRWVCVDGVLSVVGLYGCDRWTLLNPCQRTGGPGGSLYVLELCWPYSPGVVDRMNDGPVLDCASAALSGAGPEEARRTAEWVQAHPVFRGEAGGAIVRAVTIGGADGRLYIVAANFGAAAGGVDLAEVCGGDVGEVEEFPVGPVADKRSDIAPGEVRLFVASQGV